jgi:hypothetical protein
MAELIETYALRAAEEFMAASRAADALRQAEHRAAAIQYADLLTELQASGPSVDGVPLNIPKL